MIKNTVTKDAFDEAMQEIGMDVWRGFDKSETTIGYILTDEGEIAQVQISAVSDKNEWIGEDEQIPTYDEVDWWKL